jgi:phosphate-selective porin
MSAQSAASDVSATTPVRAATDPPQGDADQPSAIHIGPLRLTGYLQADGVFGLGEHDHATIDHGPLDSFRVRRARLSVNGDIVPGVGWTVGVDLVQSPVLLDAYITMRQVPAANIRVGQFLAPYSLERLASEPRNMAYERILDRFVPGRDIGIMVFSPEPIWKGLAYAVALVNGAGQNVHDNNAAKDWVGRVTWKVPAIAGVTIGANAQSGEEPGGRRTRVGADIALDSEHYHVAAEWQRQTEASQPGMPGTGSYLMVARRFRPDAPRPEFYMAELVGRIFAVRDPADALLGPPGTTHGEWEVGINYYFAKSIKATAHFLTPIARRAGEPRTTFATRLQVVF